MNYKLPSVKELLTIIEREHGVPSGSIKSKSHRVPHMQARCTAAKILQDVYRIHHKTIGKELNRHRTTILSAIRESFVSFYPDKEFKIKYYNILNMISLQIKTTKLK